MGMDRIDRVGGLDRVGSLGPSRAKARREGAAKAVDGAELSDFARELQSLMAQASGVSEVRSEKVEAIKRAIAEGRYEVDLLEVARSILRSGVLRG